MRAKLDKARRIIYEKVGSLAIVWNVIDNHDNLSRESRRVASQNAAQIDRMYHALAEKQGVCGKGMVQAIELDVLVDPNKLTPMPAYNIRLDQLRRILRADSSYHGTRGTFVWSGWPELMRLTDKEKEPYYMDIHRLFLEIKYVAETTE